MDDCVVTYPDNLPNPSMCWPQWDDLNEEYGDPKVVRDSALFLCRHAALEFGPDDTGRALYWIKYMGLPIKYWTKARKKLVVKENHFAWHLPKEAYSIDQCIDDCFLNIWYPGRIEIPVLEAKHDFIGAWLTRESMGLAKVRPWKKAIPGDESVNENVRAPVCIRGGSKADQEKEKEEKKKKKAEKKKEKEEKKEKLKLKVQKMYDGGSLGFMNQITVNKFKESEKKMTNEERLVEHEKTKENVEKAKEEKLAKEKKEKEEKERILKIEIEKKKKEQEKLEKEKKKKNARDSGVFDVLAETQDVETPPTLKKHPKKVTKLVDFNFGPTGFEADPKGPISTGRIDQRKSLSNIIAIEPTKLENSSTIQQPKLRKTSGPNDSNDSLLQNDIEEDLFKRFGIDLSKNKPQKGNEMAGLFSRNKKSNPNLDNNNSNSKSEDNPFQQNSLKKTCQSFMNLELHKEIKRPSMKIPKIKLKNTGILGIENKINDEKKQRMEYLQGYFKTNKTKSLFKEFLSDKF